MVLKNNCGICYCYFMYLSTLDNHVVVLTFGRTLFNATFLCLVAVSFPSYISILCSHCFCFKRTAFYIDTDVQKLLGHFTQSLQFLLRTISWWKLVSVLV